MNKRAWKLYLTLMAVAVIAGVAGIAAGFTWPVFNAWTQVHQMDTIFVMTPDEVSDARWALVLWRAERVGYLLTCVCAVGAFVVAMRVERKAVSA
jgi:hypothetical protein